MKQRFYLIFISSLLLLTVSYTQILSKIIVKENIINFVVTDSSEEPKEKSSEENERDADPDDDSFRLKEMIVLTSNGVVGSEIAYLTINLPGHHREIPSPPPQA